MPLTNTAVTHAKPKDKAYKLSDDKGLFLLVHPNGSKYFRFKYRIGGTEKLLALGVYPDVSLADARRRRDEARKLLANGVDPGEVKQQSKRAIRENASNSFEAIAREWFAKYKHTWAQSHADKILYRLEKDIFPWMGSRPIADIKAPELLSVIRRTESRGALDTAKRIKQNCGQVFRYAIATGRAERDPSQDLRGAIAPAKHKHFAALTDPVKVGELLRAIDGFKGTFVVQCALRLAPMFFVRPGELRRAEWASFDLDKGEWRYFVTKTKIEHSVPLAKQAIAILRELSALTGHGQYIFPGRDPQKPMSEAAVNAALRRMGYDTKTEITGHGFRAMARTILAEELHQKPEVIEHQLAHKVPDALGTAYNRTKFLKERREMMQLWADYLDRIKTGADIVPIYA
jgi:integrase